MRTSSDFIDITPQRKIGNGRTPKTKTLPIETGVLEANVVILEILGNRKLAIVSLDTLSSSIEFEKLIIEYLETDMHSVVCVASHTHNAPILQGRMADYYSFDLAVVRDTAAQVARCIDLANQKASSRVRLFAGSLACKGSVYRRKFTWELRFSPFPKVRRSVAMAADCTRKIPNELVLRVAKNENGDVLWVLWMWPCHATGINNPNCFESDFPGAVRDYFRLIFSSADIRPDSSTYFSLNRARFVYPFAKLFVNDNGFTYSRIVHSLKSAINHCVDNLMPLSVTSASEVGRVSIPVSKFFSGTAPKYLELIRISNGEFQIILMSGEISSGYVNIFENIVAPRTIMSGLVGDTFGYIPTEEQISEGGYEPERSQKFYGLDGKFVSGVEAILCGAVNKLYS